MGPANEWRVPVARLRDDLAFRRMSRGGDTLKTYAASLLCLDPCRPGAGVATGLLAQWVDAGFAEAALLERVLSQFPAESHGILPVVDYLHLRMAFGLVAMLREEFDLAMRHFQLVHSFETDIDDPELMAIAYFWAGRCLRTMGRYDDALDYAARAKAIAGAQGYRPMVAIVQLLESWLAFQKGRMTEASRILQEAEAVLEETDDYTSRGNVQSAYGRIARRQGRYTEALQCFERAIAEYEKHDRLHLHRARSLVNMAFVKRLISLDMQKALDRDAERRRSGTGIESAPPGRRLRIETLRAEAHAHLDEALATYLPHQNHRGMGSCRINFGFLYLDAGELDRAAAEGAEAFRHGECKHDFILMARGRTLQCMVENARLEEQIGDEAEHAAEALRFASSAVECAKETQNRRLLARALVWHGLTWSNEYYHNLQAAHRCYDEARALLQRPAQGTEYVWDDLQSLAARVVQGSGIDPILKAWSEGVTGDKTFQQMTEEFAAMIIPKVWMREGRKISRVAEKLSISPKKVRRILAATAAQNPEPK